MATAQRNHLLGSVKDLLTSGKYSDLVITCGDDAYQVHKNIVCARCGFFERAESFAVGREAAESIIDLPEDEPGIIKLLLQYLYEAEYSPTLPLDTSMPPEFPHTCVNRYECEIQVCAHHTCVYDVRCCFQFTCKTCEVSRLVPQGDASQLIIHTKMYEIGDKYDVLGLKELATEKFKRACEVYWRDEQFSIAAEHAFTTTPDNDKGLRECVRNTICKHREILLNPGVTALVKKHPQLMYEILTELAK